MPTGHLSPAAYSWDELPSKSSNKTALTSNHAKKTLYVFLFVCLATDGWLFDRCSSIYMYINLVRPQNLSLSSFDIAATSLNSSRSARIDLLQVISINQSINQSINFVFSQLRKSDRCLASFLFFLAVNYLACMKSQLCFHF